MQNAHERFGTLEFTKRVKDTTTHLVSMVVGMSKSVPCGQQSPRVRRSIFNFPAVRASLPVVPEWAPWFMRELNQRRAIRPLLGLGCSPVLVSGNKPTFLKWIGKALQEGLIQIPKENGSITWKLPRNFLERSTLEAPRGVRAAT
jgi:hypothetical protein